MRGLKQAMIKIIADGGKSHPARVRGLKLLGSVRPAIAYKVAPRTGAWIETAQPLSRLHLQYVAPRTGAWIETFSEADNPALSPVAPRTGAWIETIHLRRISKRGTMPIRNRG